MRLSNDLIEAHSFLIYDLEPLTALESINQFLGCTNTITMLSTLVSRAATALVLGSTAVHALTVDIDSACTYPP